MFKVASAVDDFKIDTGFLLVGVCIAGFLQLVYNNQEPVSEKSEEQTKLETS